LTDQPRAIANIRNVARAHYWRWRRTARFFLEFGKLRSKIRDKVLSIDQSEYQVGISNASTREAWVKKVLSEVPCGARLLDAGAGESPFRKHCGHLVYVSQDLGKYDGSGATGLQTGSWDTSKIDIISDITNIPMHADAFDAVLCTEVLEHVSSPVPALEELARLLKIGGTLIVTAPFCSLTHFAPYHYATGFNRYFFEYHLGRLGFEIIDMIENGNYFEYLGQEVRRIESVAKQYTSEQPTRMEKYAMQLVLNMLERMSAEDKQSQQLLHFGYHVRAVKRRLPQLQS
jgi:SAM-dependent methyltransferase